MSVDISTPSKAARMLDEQIPGWWRLVDAKELVMRSSCECVLGQIANHPKVASDAHDDYFAWERLLECLGFSFPRSGAFGGRASSLAWRRLVRQRQNKETA